MPTGQCLCFFGGKNTLTSMAGERIFFCLIRIDCGMQHIALGSSTSTSHTDQSPFQLNICEFANTNKANKRGNFINFG